MPSARRVADVSMWEQLALAAFLQRYWADNQARPAPRCAGTGPCAGLTAPPQVSCTVTFDPEAEGPQLHHALQFFQYQLKVMARSTPRGACGAHRTHGRRV